MRLLGERVLLVASLRCGSSREKKTSVSGRVWWTAVS
jgi:hypothetical protein